MSVCQLNIGSKYTICFLVLVSYLTLILWHLVDIGDVVRKEENGTSSSNKEIKREYFRNTKRPNIIFRGVKTKLCSESFVKCGNLSCNVYESNKMLHPGSKGAYIFYASQLDFSNMPLPRNPEKVIWALYHEESPKNVPELSHEKALNLFNFSSTFSRHSDIPFPLQYIKSLGYITDKKYFIKTSVKNLLLQEISPVLYLQSNCGTATERDEYVKKLMKFQRIDSYGNCLKNKHSANYSKRHGYDYLNNLWDENLLKFIARYKFVITIENGVCHDYVSEKLWRALHVGVVPIYFGSPTIRDWLPNEKSAILLEDFPNPKLLSNHINNLMHDDDLYEEYLEHKTMGKISNQNLLDELRLRPYQTDDLILEKNLLCLLCKKLYEKDKGVNIVTTSHYNCPKPVTALLQRVDENNPMVGIWDFGKACANALYDAIIDSETKDILDWAQSQPSSNKKDLIKLKFSDRK